MPDGPEAVGAYRKVRKAVGQCTQYCVVARWLALERASLVARSGKIGGLQRTRCGLPAVDGLRPQWREACDSLGGSAWIYWRHVGFPILWPSFLGATLLLFANAFSAYATAKALISQASPLVPLRIGTFLTSEIVLGQANVGKALAFGMILIVALTMGLYALLQRRCFAATALVIIMVAIDWPVRRT